MTPTFIQTLNRRKDNGLWTTLASAGQFEEVNCQILANVQNCNDMRTFPDWFLIRMQRIPFSVKVK